MTTSSSAIQPGRIKPVERRTLAEMVMRQIMDYVRDRPLGPGERLPSQLELACQLGVSRPVVREAVQGLASWGVLEIRPGSGVYVCDPTAQATNEGRIEIETHKAALEALEARMVVEIEIAALAAKRATDEDLEQLDAILVRLKRAVSRRQSTSRITLEFHWAIARSCQNNMLYRMSRLLARAQVAQGIRVEQSMPDIGAGEYESHLRLRDAVAGHDPEMARMAMRRHLEVAHGWESEISKHRRLSDEEIHRE